MESKHLLVASRQSAIPVHTSKIHKHLLRAGRLHLVPILVSNTMVNGFQVDLWHEFRDRIHCRLGTIARQEGTLVARLLDECVGCFAVSANGRQLDTAMVVLEHSRCLYDFRASLDNALPH